MYGVQLHSRFIIPMHMLKNFSDTCLGTTASSGLQKQAVLQLILPRVNCGTHFTFRLFFSLPNRKLADVKLKKHVHGL